MNLPNPYPTILVHSTAFFFITIDQNGSIKYANNYFSRHTHEADCSHCFAGSVQVIKNLISGFNVNSDQVMDVVLELTTENAACITTNWNFSRAAYGDGAIVQGLGTIKNNNLAEHSISQANGQHSHLKVDLILENISDGYFTVNSSMIVHDWNPKAEEIFRLKQTEVVGENLLSAIDSLPSSIQKEFEKAFSQNKPVLLQEYFPSLKSWFEISAYPDGGLLSVFFVNITDRKRSNEEVRTINERLKVVEMATKDVIWDWDLKTNNVVWNDNVKLMFGFANEAVNSMSRWWLDHLHPEDRGRVITNLKRHIKEHLVNWQNEYRFRCANGAYKYVYDRGFAIYDENMRPVRMIGTMQDLTERKASEFILKKLNNSLEKRAKELAASNDELERFAYVTSHDLQEPLRMVTSFLQLLQKRYKDKLDPKAHEYIGFAVDGAERMKGLILDLLEYSRVNTNKGAMEEVDLNEVADNILLTYKQLLIETEGELNITKLPVVKGNRTQLTQLFQNLVGNALKYRSVAPPKVEIIFSEQPHEFEFVVKDNGIGIEPRFYNKIFVIFQRLHHKNEYSGTGIGLAICKKIIEKHGGRIWVESEPNAGSCFYFTIPK